jgi:hypothetical protein
VKNVTGRGGKLGIPSSSYERKTKPTATKLDCLESGHNQTRKKQQDAMS